MADTNLLYQKIANDLRESIYSGTLKEGERLPTEMDLAKQYDVSRITSKRALEELKQSGLAYSIRGSGTYVAKLSHRQEADISERKSLYKQVVSMVIPFRSADGGIVDTLTGVTNVLRAAGYMVDINCLPNREGDIRKGLMQICERGTAGLIYYPSSDSENLDLLNMLYMEKFPLVIIDKRIDALPLYSVVCDNQKGMRDVVEYLLSLGHKKIAFVTDKKIGLASSVRDRYFGYAQALREAGIIAQPGWVLDGTYKADDMERGKTLLRGLLQQGVTAVCAINDGVATSVMRCLKLMGLEVPEDISVTGFDDIRVKNLTEKPLTTVRQDMYQIGSNAANIMLELLRGETPAMLHKVLPTELKIRETCAECKIE